MQTIAVAGLGQIGGSIGRGLVKRGFAVTGFDQSGDTMAAASRCGITPAGELAALVDCDIIFVCVSLNRNAEVLRQLISLAESRNRQPTVTDVASYKLGTSTNTEALDCVILGHPMAGSHGSGFDSSNGELFAGAQWPLIWNRHKACARALDLIDLISKLGARVQLCDREWHDATMSLISGLPHALSLALGKVAAEVEDAAAKLPLAAGSYKSATRVLLSDENFFRDLLWYNRSTLAPLLDRFAAQLLSLSTALRADTADELSQLVSAARESIDLVETPQLAHSQVRVPSADLADFLHRLTNSGTSIAGFERHAAEIISRCNLFAIGQPDLEVSRHCSCARWLQ